VQSCVLLFRHIFFRSSWQGIYLLPCGALAWRACISRIQISFSSTSSSNCVDCTYSFMFEELTAWKNPSIQSRARVSRSGAPARLPQRKSTQNAGILGLAATRLPVYLSFVTEAKVRRDSRRPGNIHQRPTFKMLSVHTTVVPIRIYHLMTDTAT